MERRKHPRVRCDLRCDLEIGGRSAEGNVSDVSEGGLAVRAMIEPPSEGEPVRLSLRRPSQPSIEVKALVWHARRGRDKRIQLGLVLSDAGDDFFTLVNELRVRAFPRKRMPTVRNPAGPAAPEACAARPEVAPAAPPEAASPPVEPESIFADPEPPPLSRFAVRVKQEGGPRSRRVMVAGSSADDARERALEEVGSGWSILEVEAVAPGV